LRRLLYLLAVISLPFGALPAALLPAQAPPSAQDTLAYTTATVRLREKPLATARALAVLRQGTPVRLYDCSEGWCRVVVSKLAGYVLEEFLTAQPQPIAQGRGYINSQGVWVPSPTRTADGQPPAGATAKCRDGTFSFSQSRRGTCSHHGGVAEWL
jgi:uncharacterized protein YraI